MKLYQLQSEFSKISSTVITNTETIDGSVEIETFFIFKKEEFIKTTFYKYFIEQNEITDIDFSEWAKEIIVYAILQVR